MADFLKAYKITNKFEGGWNHIKGDRGGETYCGIARNFFPKWKGWEIVDSKKPLKHEDIIKDDVLHDLVHSFYKNEFWDKIKGDSIVSQLKANQLYDMAVNAGVSNAIKLCQKTLDITESGKMDKITLEKLNA
jgi:lysozyme family protein